MSENDLIEMIRRQIKQKNFKLESFIDNYDEMTDVFEGDDVNEASGQDYLDDEEGQVDEDNGYEQQVSPKNQRLSTILEVSCEDSPLKKPNPIKEFNAKPKKIETVVEESCIDVQPVSLDDDKDAERDDQDFSMKSKDALDIDNLPIGVKPTNKMSFEELIEEKLKIADQLDQEQFKNSNNKTKKKPVSSTNKTREKFLQAKAAKPQTVTAPTLISSTNKSSKPDTIAQSQQQHIVEKQAEIISESTTQPTSNKQPRKYLKRGEGLKRYQPPSTKLAQKQSVSIDINIFY